MEFKTKHNLREDIFRAYMAGIIDGEGTIGIQRHKKNNRTGYIKYMPYIQLVNTDYDLVKMFSDFIGGTAITKHIGSKNGYKSRRDCYVTKKSGTIGAIKVIKKLYPFLFVKKNLADLVIRLSEEGKKYNCKGKKIKRNQSNLPTGEAQRRADIYKKYLSIVHPQRLSERTPKGEATVQAKN